MTGNGEQIRNILTEWAHLSKILSDRGIITEYQMKQCHKYAITGSKKAEKKYEEEK